MRKPNSDPKVILERSVEIVNDRGTLEIGSIERVGALGPEITQDRLYVSGPITDQLLRLRWRKYRALIGIRNAIVDVIVG